MPGRLWTIGHSTHTEAEFLGLLGGHHIEMLADVRTVPRSRRHPHFSSAALDRSLAQHGVEYRHLPGLGGWRHPRADSSNMGWRNASFRGYADYALSDAFADALGELCTLASSKRTAIMCSEARWWRCHRRLIADRLTSAGWEVSHISADGRSTPHELTDFGVVCDDGRVLYPGLPDARGEYVQESFESCSSPHTSGPFKPPS